MSSKKEDGLIDYSKEVLKKFRSAPETNREMMDQLKALPDKELERIQGEYGRNVLVSNEVKDRGLEEE